MKKLLTFIVITAFSIIPFTATADTATLMQDGDKLFNDRKGSMEDLEKSIAIYKQILEKEADNFEAAWKCSRSYRFYGDKAKINNVEGWKKICAKYGKQGMEMAQTAIDLKPDNAAGFYYYASNVGVYSDGVSIFRALKEGLKNKTQSSLEKSIELDSTFENGAGILGLGRFWAVLPWPMKSKKKSLKYYKEYQATPFFGKDPEGYIFVSELLIDMGGKKRKAEAKELLNKFDAPNKYFQDYKDKLLKKL